MNWRANSLFGRTALLIAGLILASQLITTTMFLYWVQRPRVMMMAELAESHLESVRAALALLPVDQREQYLARVAMGTSLNVQATPPEQASPQAAPNYAIRHFLTAFQARLGPYERVLYQTSPTPTIWVNILVNEQPYWVKFSANQFDTRLGARWLEVSLGIALLSCLGGLYLHRTLNSPLQRLSKTANLIGLGKRSAPITDEGPKELVDVIHAVNSMQENLSRMEEDRNFMLAGISHDLRTPITRIQLALEMLDANNYQDVRKRVQSNLNEIDHGLTQCLDFARKVEDEPLQTADLNDLARLMADRYGALGHPIQLTLCESAVVNIRPFALERLLNNLINNAIKYAHSDITIETASYPQQVTLRVLDRGPGMLPEELARLRRAFTRADQSRGGEIGFGLGLAIVDKIIEAHQAKIEYLPRAGGGLQIEMSFPIQSP